MSKMQSNGTDSTQPEQQNQRQQPPPQQWVAMQYPAAAMVMQHQMMPPQHYPIPPPPHYMPYPQYQQHHPQHVQPQQHHHHQGSSSENKTVWVGDLHHWMDENYLHTCFASTGEVVSFSFSGTFVYVFTYLGLCCVVYMSVQLYFLVYVMVG